MFCSSKNRCDMWTLDFSLFFPSLGEMCIFITFFFLQNDMWRSVLFWNFLVGEMVQTNWFLWPDQEHRDQTRWGGRCCCCCCCGGGGGGGCCCCGCGCCCCCCGCCCCCCGCCCCCCCCGCGCGCGCGWWWLWTSKIHHSLSYPAQQPCPGKVDKWWRCEL